MEYLYLAMAVVTSGLSSPVYKKISGVSKNPAMSLIIPAAWFLPLAVIFGVTALIKGEFVFSGNMIFTSLLAGISAAACAFSLLESMKQNSFPVAVIIVNLSFIFPVILSMIFLGEKAHILQLAGMLVTVAAVVILGTSGKGAKTAITAMILAVVSSLGNGGIDFAIKLQQHKTPGEGEATFFFFTYLIAAILSIAAYGAVRPFKKRRLASLDNGGIPNEYTAALSKGNTASDNDIPTTSVDSKIPGENTPVAPVVSSGGVYSGQKRKDDDAKSLRKTVLIYAPMIAICNGLCFLGVSLLADKMNAAAQFTLITSLSIIISLVAGFIFSHERIKPRELLCLLFCAAAIACQYFNLTP